MPGGAVLTKSQFAASLPRHPSFVTRAIDEGKISGDALIGSGRSARIVVDVALRQLGLTLDPAQQLSQAQPILAAAPAPAAPASGDLPLTAGTHADRQEHLALKNTKLRAEIERGAREDAARAGALVDAAGVTRALGRQLAPLVGTFDELPAAIAKPLSEQFGIPYAEALIAVKGAVRSQRASWAERARLLGQAAALAETETAETETAEAAA